jgi:hypothetical protein
VFVVKFPYFKLIFPVFIRKFKATFPTYIFLILLFWGCTKIDTTKLGQGLLPVVDNIHTFDTTFTVIANNFDDPSNCDSILRTDLHALGIISNDPLFGKSTANIYVELKPQYYPFTFPASDPDSLLLDSAVIVLQYSHTFGDTTVLQKAKVYQLLNNFKYDSVYTTCDIFGYDNNLLGEKSYYPQDLKDSIHAVGEDANNELRIPISKSLIQNFINDSTNLLTDSAFIAYFKGFAIVPDQATGGQALNYFNLTSASTRLAIYLRTSLSNVKDTTVVNFPMTVYSAESNSIIHDRGTSEITSHLSHPLAGDSLLYIQTSPGSYAQLTIPGLSGLSNRVINRAELIVDQIYSPSALDNIFTAPVNLYLDTKDTSTNGTYIPIPCDFSSSELSTNFSSMGGAAKLIPDGSGNLASQYTFNISRYVQSIVTKGSNNAVLRLSAPYYIVNHTAYADRCNQLIPSFSFQRNDIGEGRVKLNGTNNSPTRIRLHIVYSTL